MSSEQIAKLQSIAEKALDTIQSIEDLSQLESLRVSILGKKGSLNEVLRGLKDVDPGLRPQIGAKANQWKKQIEEALQGRQSFLQEKKFELLAKEERVDTTLPARTLHYGTYHPITSTTIKLVEVFKKIGFEVTTGPEIETEFLNFDAINIPADHPARDMQDTFFMGPGRVLRTHTSPVQMRTMKSREWPIRIVCPGAVYRCDSDATHSPMFHQIEGLWVDRNVRMSDLKGVLDFFAKEIFGPEVSIRMRPSYFPFVEPGAEVDISCFLCRSKSKGSARCVICKDTGWLEVLGAGMVHPHLFEVAGYSTKGEGKLSGFAFGVGIERIAMLLHQIPDIRHFFKGDIRFLKQF